MKLKAVALIIGFAWISFAKTYAQNSDSSLKIDIDKFIFELQKAGVDTICVYQEYCVGCEIKWNNKSAICEYSGYYIPTHIFWKNNGITYFTYRNNCFKYTTGKINADTVWDFCLKNFEELKSEKIKIAQYEKIINGESLIFDSSIDHSERQNIVVIINNVKVEKYFDDFNFWKSLDFQGKKQNINYTYNMNTKSKQLQLTLSKFVKDIALRAPLKKITN